jgi:hypothetical protein
MAKESFYFSHDFGARNDPKLQKVLMKLGHEGKSVFWDLIEIIYEQGGKLLLSECDNYAFALRTTEGCILSLINDFDLFKNDGKYFWSDSINDRLNKRNAKSIKAKESAIFRWEKHANEQNKNANAHDKNAFALPKESERNTIKNNKVNKIDIKDRREAFKNALSPFLSKYNKDLLNDFFKYWTEPNQSKTKMRFEFEKTWDLSLRLSNWNKGDKKTDFKQQNNYKLDFSNVSN